MNYCGDALLPEGKGPPWERRPFLGAGGNGGGGCPRAGEPGICSRVPYDSGVNFVFGESVKHLAGLQLRVAFSSKRRKAAFQSPAGLPLLLGA